MVKKPCRKAAFLYIFTITVLVFACSVSCADFTTSVFLADSNEPLPLTDSNMPILQYEQIMVGTRLKIIVSSDANASNWWGSLFIKDPYRNRGTLMQTDESEIVLEAAGPGAVAFPTEDSVMSGYDLITGASAVAGDWFMVDYVATSPGNCKVGVYDTTVSIVDPVYKLSFHNVKTRDFNGDHTVNFEDFACFGNSWGWHCSEFVDPNNCDIIDLDESEIIDFNDLDLFADFWLRKSR